MDIEEETTIKHVIMDIVFRLENQSQILKLANVPNIYNTYLPTINAFIKERAVGSLFDLRMGAYEDNPCENPDCRQPFNKCKGHIGKIVLQTPIYNIVHKSFILKLLDYFDYLHWSNTKKIRSKFSVDTLKKVKINITNFEDISKKLETLQTDPSYRDEVKYVLEMVGPETLIPIIRMVGKRKSDINEMLEVEKVLDFFKEINDNHKDLLDLYSIGVNPMDSIMRIIIVIPPKFRQLTEISGNMIPTEYNKNYKAIIEANNALGERLGRRTVKNEELMIVEKADKGKGKSISRLVADIYKNFHLFVQNENQPTSSIKGALQKKNGMIRKNLEGNIVVNLMRGPVTPSKYLNDDQIGIGSNMAKLVLVQVTVIKENKSDLEKMIKEGKVKKITKKSGHTNLVLKKPILEGKLKPIKMFKNISTSVSLSDDDSVEERRNKLEDIKVFLREASILVVSKGEVVKRVSLGISIPKRLDPESTDFFKKEQEKRVKIVNDLIGDGFRKFEFYKAETSIYYTLMDLEEGDIIHRVVMDDDIVVINRPPTLHKQSIVALKVKIFHAKLYSFYLKNSYITGMNADYDGDRVLSPTTDCRRRSKFTSMGKQCKIWTVRLYNPLVSL